MATTSMDDTAHGYGPAFHPPPAEDVEHYPQGAAEVDDEQWQLVITGLVTTPFSINLSDLRSLPSRTVTSFHECYGSPLVPPTKALRRIGNVKWTGVPLRDLMDRAGILPSSPVTHTPSNCHDKKQNLCPNHQSQGQPRYIWTEGLDRGIFAKITADRYQKDLPLDKALSPEVLVAYEMNSRPLSTKRGGPVRLVVPGWFGTNSTKWLCKIIVASSRAPGPFTTTFYNEVVPNDRGEMMTRPVWRAQVNSIIIRPRPEEEMKRGRVLVKGWAWSCGGVKIVCVSVEGSDREDRAGKVAAEVDERTEFSWQKFRAVVRLDPGKYVLTARAEGSDGEVQPLEKARNHVHRVSVTVT